MPSHCLCWFQWSCGAVESVARWISVLQVRGKLDGAFLKAAVVVTVVSLCLVHEPATPFAKREVSFGSSPFTQKVSRRLFFCRCEVRMNFPGIFRCKKKKMKRIVPKGALQRTF